MFLHRERAGLDEAVEFLIGKGILPRSSALVLAPGRLANLLERVRDGVELPMDERLTVGQKAGLRGEAQDLLNRLVITALARSSDEDQWMKEARDFLIHGIGIELAFSDDYYDPQKILKALERVSKERPTNDEKGDRARELLREFEEKLK